MKAGGEEEEEEENKGAADDKGENAEGTESSLSLSIFAPSRSIAMSTRG